LDEIVVGHGQERDDVLFCDGHMTLVDELVANVGKDTCT